MLAPFSRLSSISKKLSCGLKLHESALQFRRSLVGYSEAGRSIFNEQLKNVNESTNYKTNFQSAHAVVREIISDENLFFRSPIVSERNKELIDYNNLGGNGWRIKLFLNAYKHLAPSSELTNENILRASIMGYLTELLTSSFIILDDMFDESEQRRNKLCWYKKVGVTLASNDSLLLINAIYLVMKQIFENQPYYVPCLKIFQDVCWIATCSLPLDFRTLNVLTKYEENCTWEVFEHLSFSEVTGTAFFLPIMTAMNMAGYDNSDFKVKMVQIMTQMGNYMKMENDYSDRYGFGTGKMLDEDIRRGKLTWLLLKTLERVNEQQRNTLKQCYGKPDDKHVKAIVDIYEQIGIKKIHKNQIQQLLNSITLEIKSIRDEKVQKVLLDILHMIGSWYKYEDNYMDG